MSMAVLVQLASHGGSRVCRRMVLNRVRFIQDKLVRLLHSPSGTRASNSRFDPDSSGRPTTWDSFGIWDNRIDEPILLPSSIRYGKLIPKVSLSKVGYASQIGQRKENEDRYQVSQMTNDILYFAVFDGHSGAQAADFCHKYMEQYIKELVAKEDNLEVVLTNAFLNVDEALAKHLNFSADELLLGQLASHLQVSRKHQGDSKNIIRCCQSGTFFKRKNALVSSGTPKGPDDHRKQLW